MGLMMETTEKRGKEISHQWSQLHAVLNGEKAEWLERLSSFGTWYGGLWMEMELE